MEVILKKDVKGTGKAGEIVKVSDGFARNRLIPRGEAVEATEGNKRAMEKAAAKMKERFAQDKAAAEEFAKKLSGAPVVIKTKAGEGGRLFGSITSMDIAEAIKEQIGEEIDRRKIVLEKPIKEMGVSEVEIKIFQDVSAKMEVRIEDGKED
ncbi:MAG: 50S ribosomal protein L9 [Mogibacterium sp.]|nr:50S ribosomal protein L9 [Mogibacterium sp.]